MKLTSIGVCEEYDPTLGRTLGGAALAAGAAASISAQAAMGAHQRPTLVIDLMSPIPPLRPAPALRRTSSQVLVSRRERQARVTGRTTRALRMFRNSQGHP